MNRKAKAFMVIKNDEKGLEVQRTCVYASGKQMSLLPKRQAEVRGQLVSFWELTARSDKVKTSVEHQG